MVRKIINRKPWDSYLIKLLVYDMLDTIIAKASASFLDENMHSYFIGLSN